MTSNFEDLLYLSGLTAQGSWELLDGYDRECILKFGQYIVKECINIACEYDKPKLSGPGLAIACNIESHFDIYIEEDGRFVK